MQKFTTLTGLVAPLNRSNIDTDAIIPKQFLKSIKRTGFGPNLFDEWRYLDHGEPGMDNSTRPLNSDFVLNEPRYRGAQILLTRDNFGCGSSREHAPWALLDYGFRVIIAPSFADIFFNNCFKNGVLAITVDHAVIDRLFDAVTQQEGYTLTVDLAQQTIATPNGGVIAFNTESFYRHRLLNGLDDIGMALQHSAEIEAYEQRRRATAPWLFSNMT